VKPLFCVKSCGTQIRALSSRIGLVRETLLISVKQSANRTVAASARIVPFMARPSGPKPRAKRLARHVFISYARKDGTDTAQHLYDVLQRADCKVWLDTERIRGGASWSKDIEGALNGCEVLVAVLTPGSYVSEICRAEQIWALEQGKVVIPVLAVDGAPVPLHLKSRNYRKYPEQQAELLADIGHPAPAAAPIPVRCTMTPCRICRRTMSCARRRWLICAP
jgi:hypothetical protein